MWLNFNGIRVKFKTVPNHMDVAATPNKASCLSLLSNAVLLWNTLKMSEIISKLQASGMLIDERCLSHISLLPYKHVIPMGTYFIDDIETE